ncbi:MAG: hypothetical protein UCN61_05085 [Ruminococcus sp.]|nr:hypothetical protein [Ruminococcus sp.]
MIIKISSNKFKNIFKNEKLHLPIRWDGDDFIKTLETLYSDYLDSCPDDVAQEVKKCCSLIIESVRYYLNGFPAKAYSVLKELMEFLMKQPLQLYGKSIDEGLSKEYNDPLDLYRIVGVSDNKKYDRTRVFHTPYNLRSKVSTSRYSIAGYPSLYLGTSIDLCREEVRLNPYDKFEIASLFKLDRKSYNSGVEISVIELALKPQDFFNSENNEMNNSQLSNRRFSDYFLRQKEVQSAYVLWYPLIAACSFIRVNKSDPFAVEYIIPQLLMQWVRKEMQRVRNEMHGFDKLIGIRYFSCASERASDLGFNYVFPTSGEQSPEFPFCKVLSKAFILTEPVYIHEFDSVCDCEKYLKNQHCKLCEPLKQED